MQMLHFTLYFLKQALLSLSRFFDATTQKSVQRKEG